jgi:hypothetical protein
MASFKHNHTFPKSGLQFNQTHFNASHYSECIFNKESFCFLVKVEYFISLHKTYQILFVIFLNRSGVNTGVLLYFKICVCFIFFSIENRNYVFIITTAIFYCTLRCFVTYVILLQWLLSNTITHFPKAAFLCLN